MSRARANVLAGAVGAALSSGMPLLGLIIAVTVVTFAYSVVAASDALANRRH